MIGGRDRAGGGGREVARDRRGMYDQYGAQRVQWFHDRSAVCDSLTNSEIQTIPTLAGQPEVSWYVCTVSIPALRRRFRLGVWRVLL